MSLPTSQSRQYHSWSPTQLKYQVLIENILMRSSFLTKNYLHFVATLHCLNAKPHNCFILS